MGLYEDASTSPPSTAEVPRFFREDCASEIRPVVSAADTTIVIEGGVAATIVVVVGKRFSLSIIVLSVEWSKDFDAEIAEPNTIGVDKKATEAEEGSIEVEGNRGVDGGEVGNNKAEDNRVS